MCVEKTYIAILAGEESGDKLGAALMQELHKRGTFRFAGIGGTKMHEQGLQSFFPMEEISLMGITAVLKNLPNLMKRLKETTQNLRETPPAALIIIDAPDFTQRVAKRLKKTHPAIPVINYVSPTVWAWRSGRAKHMKQFIDHILALLPFEPAAHERLGGPPCTYVGHPVLERINALTPNAQEQTVRENQPFKLLCLLGSRKSELERLSPIFQQLCERASQTMPLEIICPTTKHMEGLARQITKDWQLPVTIISNEEEKQHAFRIARAALAASGTVTLELAVAKIPMIVGYRLDPLAARLRWLGNVDSIVLANLVAGENYIPEFVHETCNAEEMLPALQAILTDEETRQKHLQGCNKVIKNLTLKNKSASALSADIICSLIK